MDATKSEPLIRSIVEHETLSLDVLANNLLAHLSLLTLSEDEQQRDQQVQTEYTVIKPALFRLYEEDPGAFSRVSKKIKHHWGITLKALEADMGILGACAPEAEPAGRGSSQATRLVALAANCALWHTPEKAGYVTIEVNEHQEHHLLRSKEFTQYLRRLYYEHTQSAPGSQAVQDALGVLEAKALFAGEEHPVFLRVAEHQGCMYLDLCDPGWQAVKITCQGWDIISDPPIKFRRPKSLRALPHPVKGGTLKQLRRFVNIASADDWTMLLAWLLMSLRACGPYPILLLTGGQGSAKSTLARILKALLDPCVGPIRAALRDARDLMIAADNSWILAFDNLSHFSDHLSDALCRLATGGGFSTRELYSDREEVVFDAQRPVVVTSIVDLITRSDALDRTVILTLTEIAEKKRSDEKSLWAEFTQAAPEILGALCTAASVALARGGKVKLKTTPRMADFTRWAVAAEPALGLKRGAFLKAYAKNRQAAHHVALEDSPVARIIRLYLKRTTKWEGTAAQLLVALTDVAFKTVRREREWPKNARSLGSALRRLVPNLRAVDIDVRFLKKNDDRIIEIIRMPPGRRTQTSDGAGGKEIFASGKKSCKNKPPDAPDAPDAKKHLHSNAHIEDIASESPLIQEENQNQETFSLQPLEQRGKFASFASPASKPLDSQENLRTQNFPAASRGNAFASGQDPLKDSEIIE